MDRDVLVAHPHKHHLLHLAAGVAAAMTSMALATPFYQTGVGKLAARVPGRVGAKARGYRHPLLRSSQVVAPFTWQCRRLIGFAAGWDIGHAFDEWVADRLRLGDWHARVVVTAQDYMPLTSRAAKSIGAVLVSDQISNQSDEAMARIERHTAHWGIRPSRHDESVNTELLGEADHVLAPSGYTADGIRARVSRTARLHVIPYGVDVDRFRPSAMRHRATEVCIVARANSVRKGGHLLLEALRQIADGLFVLASHRVVQVRIVGEMEHRLLPLLEDVRVSTMGKLVIDARNYAHADMPALLQDASLFVMPSLSEGMSLAALEAAISRIPLIVTPYCGLDDFQTYRHGLLVDDNANSLAAALVDAFHRRSEWEHWAEEARQMALGLSWEQYERRVANVFQHV